MARPVVAGRGRGPGPPPGPRGIFNEELGRAGAPPAPHVGFLGRAILLFGTDAQRSRWLPSLLSGEEAWCQGFSEPGAGSDLGALATRGTLEDGRWTITGQKVWTSDAQHADWCLLLVRTEPDQPKHRGISCIVVDVHQPGVTVRPLRQITGDSEFNEVFLDEATAPADHLVGERGQGWALAMATLGYERGPADIGFTSRYERALGIWRPAWPPIPRRRPPPPAGGRRPGPTWSWRPSGSRWPGASPGASTAPPPGPRDRSTSC